MWGISYWVFPFISAFVWVGMLISMLVYWCAIGRPVYPSMEAGQTIAYISDVGAETLKPLFIAGSCVTTLFLDLAFFSDRWLRHRGRLAKNQTVAEKVLSGFAMLFAIVGTCGLILLSIFDTLRHPKLHDIFLVLFIGGYIIAAIFICAEYQRLGIHFREHRILRASFWIKLTFIIIEVILAIVFGVCSYKHVRNVAACVEWAIVFIFTFWVLSFVIDLAPVASRTSNNAKGHDGQTEMQVESNDLAAEQSRTTHGRNFHGDAFTANGVQYVRGPHGVTPTTTPSNF